jgi:putative ABC transport system substrate-binding protein
MRSLSLALLALLLCALPRLAWAGPVVAALKSDDLELYRQALAGFAAQAPDLTVEEFDLGGDAKKADAVLAQVKERKPALVLALGPLAANAARRGFDAVPVLFAMVPNYEKYGLDAKNVTGIALTRPLEDQLGAIKALSPSARKVGVLYTPEYSQPVIDQATRAAEALGLQLKVEKLGKDREAGAAAAALAPKVDALWMIADRGTATVAASTAIIGAAREARVPLYALTEAQVREGALIAFAASPQSIGAQAGKLAQRIVVEKVNPGALAVASPTGLEAWISAGTLKADADAAFAGRLLDYAAQKNIALRATP